MTTRLGTIDSIYRYPVKSMGCEALADARVTFAGLVGDRVWAFVAPEAKADFPWHTAREQSDMLLYKPRFLAPPPHERLFPEARDYAVEVETPDGTRLAIDDPRLAKGLKSKFASDLVLRFSERGQQDARPVSLFGLGTIAALREETGLTNLDDRRFRPNFSVRWDDATPFYEDTLVGKRLLVGEKCELQIVKKDPRCVMINLDPDTAQAAPEVLKNVARKHAGCAGVYAAVLREGVVRQGDEVKLLGTI